MGAGGVGTGALNMPGQRLLLPEDARLLRLLNAYDRLIGNTVHQTETPS